MGRTWLAVCLVGQVFLAGAQGLPGENLVTQRWRDLFSNYSPLSNPAFLTQENYLTARGVFTPQLQGNSQLWELGLTLPVGLYQSAGISWIAENATIDTIAQSPGATYSFQNNFLMATWAYNIWRGLSLGINVNLALQNAFGEPLQMGYGADIGASYRLIKSPVVGNHIVGINAQNIIAPVLKSSETGNEETYSRNLRFTLSSNYWEKQIESNFDFCLKDFMATADDYGDSAKKMEWEFTGRVGFSVMRTAGLFLLGGIDNTGFKYWGLAFAGNIPAINQGRDFNFAYQYNQLPQGQIPSNTVYLRGSIGDSRELMYAKKMARSLDIAPNTIYLAALKLYSEGKFWDAYFLFSQIINDYPDFFKIDWVLYYAGSCQENLDMRENSLFTYQSLKAGFPQSNAAHNADLGTMRVYYRMEDYAKVAQQFTLLDKAEVPDSLRGAAYFILGQTHMAQKDYSKAYEILSAVPPDHPDYLFAQHSAAIALLAVNKPMDAVSHLQTCIDANPQTLSAAQKEIVNRSNLFLAYILYEGLIQEERPLSKAVTLLRKIPQGSGYYNEGLLLMGWTAVKAHQAADCISSGKVLQTAKNPLFHFEGALIEAYGHMMQREYDESKSILEDASRQMAVLKAPTDDSLALEKQRYIGTRTSYDFLAKKISECAQKQQVGPVLQENNTLHDQQIDLKGKIDVSISFFDWYKKESFLTRNIGSIKEDISYLLAVVSKRASDRGNQKEINKMINKTKDIDKEIEKLKGKLENLDKDKK
ncbi:MAG: tetratricopeptide repeat protein [Chitinivibrionales bacterium]